MGPCSCHLIVPQVSENVEQLPLSAVVPASLELVGQTMTMP